MQTRTDPEARAKVWELIKDINMCMLVTQNADGMLHARPMAAMKRDEAGDCLWFMTRADSLKVTEIERDPKVLLSYSEPKHQHYVSITGRADVVQDRAKIKELWSEFARPWFPKGPDDPAIALVRVKAEAAEYWDSPSSAFVYAYGYVKARLTGESPKKLGETGRVAM